MSQDEQEHKPNKCINWKRMCHKKDKKEKIIKIFPPQLGFELGK
jgi:hypothetical protein